MDIEKEFDRIQKKVMEWATRKRGLPEVIVRAMMSLHRRAKIKVRTRLDLSAEFLVQVGVHQGFVLSPLLFAISVNVITKYARLDE